MQTEIAVRSSSSAAALARKIAIGALCFGALAVAAPASSTAVMAAQGLEGMEAAQPAAAPDTSLELENSAASEAATGISPQAVVRSACLLPFRKITYPIFLNGKGVFKFLTTPKAPPKGFNVVMTLKFPGLSRTVNNFGPSKAEVFNVKKTFAARINGKVTISGVGGSYGCFVLKITP